MVVYPKLQQTKFEKDEYFFSVNSVLTVPKDVLSKETIVCFKKLFSCFTAGIGKLNIIQRQGTNVAYFADIEKELSSENIEKGYILNFGKDGLKIVFKTNSDLIYAFYTMLSLIEVKSATKNKELFTLPIGRVIDFPKTDIRMIHICIFPDTPYKKFVKFIKLIGFMKYTHLIVEFWGTYKYKCEKRMCCEKHYSKNQIKKVISLAKEMGLKLIPMVNCFGHAGQSRIFYGRHATLDYYPKMAPYFDNSGWVWNIVNENVLDLQLKMIDELIDVFSGCEYFHIGCDEAYTFGNDRAYIDIDKTLLIANHINKLNQHIKAKGLKTLMWADMLLFGEEFNGCVKSGKSREDCDKFISILDKDIILVDWQYELRHEDIPTTKYLSSKGFNVMLAGFNDIIATTYCVNNVEKYNYYGYMHTTWHLIARDLSIIPYGATLSWSGADSMTNENMEVIKSITGAYLRKLCPSKRYRETGINSKEIEN